jgi:hypothetical protein
MTISDSQTTERSVPFAQLLRNWLLVVNVFLGMTTLPWRTTELAKNRDPRASRCRRKLGSPRSFLVPSLALVHFVRMTSSFVS